MSATKTTIKDVTFTRQEMTVHFSDGRKITAPLAWYPRLLKASPAERAKWKVLGKDRGIHWPKVDEDLSIEGILHGIPSVEYRTSGMPQRRVGNMKTGKSEVEARI
jgi:hypothetical protein